MATWPRIMRQKRLTAAVWLRSWAAAMAAREETVPARWRSCSVPLHREKRVRERAATPAGAPAPGISCNEQTLPVHRALRPLPPAAPSQLQVRWNSEAELELRWNNPETGILNAGYWLETIGSSLEMESTFFTLRGLQSNRRSLTSI